MPILTIEAHGDGATNAPYWVIIDPRQMMRPDIHDVASMISGPFFDRDEAFQYLEARPYVFSKRARVYCLSGHYSRKYQRAWDEAQKLDQQ